MFQICDSVFGLTPIINNESVNKNEITSIAANSRNKIISALLRNELEPNLGLSGTGQEVSIMRSTLLGQPKGFHGITFPCRFPSDTRNRSRESPPLLYASGAGASRIDPPL